MKKNITVIAISIVLSAGLTFAGDMARSITLPDIKVELKAGAGKDKVETLCNICHSTDYITTQPPLSKAQWTANVNKMIKVFGAPIKEEDPGKIIDYLTVQYGSGK
ncbi:MAG: cytochrome c [Nitrospirae bacterium]|nr:MAG: cytochrome c [Nitrospirota bacterium]